MKLKYHAFADGSNLPSCSNLTAGSIFLKFWPSTQVKKKTEQFDLSLDASFPEMKNYK